MFVYQFIRTLGFITETQDTFHQTSATLPIHRSRWTSAWFYDFSKAFDTICHTFTLF